MWPIVCTLVSPVMLSSGRENVTASTDISSTSTVLSEIYCKTASSTIGSTAGEVYLQRIALSLNEIKTTSPQKAILDAILF